MKGHIRDVICVSKKNWSGVDNLKYFENLTILLVALTPIIAAISFFFIMLKKRKI